MDEQISKSEILLIEWDKGSDKNKDLLAKHRLLIETYAYNCMERLEKENKRIKELRKK